MSTHQEVQARLSYARSLLERRVTTQTIATMISAKYIVCRSTAYDDIKAANAELQLSDDGPSIEESSEPVSTDNVLAMLQHLFDVASATGDTKTVCSLVKAMDQAKRWQGYNTQSSSPFA